MRGKNMYRDGYIQKCNIISSKKAQIGTGEPMNTPQQHLGES